jgi:glutamine synthetase
MNLRTILQRYLEKLQNEFNLIPVIGCELEFYVSRPSPELMSLGLDMVEERGHNQFEIRLGPTTDIFKLIKELEAAKEKIVRCVTKASFKAKPFEDQPGSALHMHLNFMTTEGLHEPAALSHAIAGLLHTMPELMIFFAPTSASYKRYSSESMTTPTKIAWGPNNRTAALRLIKDHNQTPRLEHRVAGSDADPTNVAAAILFGSYLGIKDKLIPDPPVYGLAFDPQYNLPSLPPTLNAAKKNFTKSGLFLSLT